jgi:hypothetical protein
MRVDTGNITVDYENKTVKIGKKDNSENVITYKVNETIGYFYDDFTWPADENLHVTPDSTVAQHLDTIQNKLGNYEYFFDVDGIFHFQ